MPKDATMLRLFVSQVFIIYYLLVMIPIKEPKKKNIVRIVVGALIITIINAALIHFFGILTYIRFYFITLVLPHLFLFIFFAKYKGGKLVFALLSSQVIGNIAITNGLFTAYIFYQQNNPLIDTAARVLTYLLFLPILFRFITPTYLKMAKMLDKGWWILNFSLVLSYVVLYFILFVPTTIFERPEYFIHAYAVICLCILIYAIIFYLFVVVQKKVGAELDKQNLSNQVSSLAAQSIEIKNIAYKDSLTGINNRYSLFRQMDQLIENKQNFLVVFIDLDNLKKINDTYSHAKGDFYLAQFALAIKNTIQETGEVYRFAGDEFICLIKPDYTHFNGDQFRENVTKAMVFDLPFLGFSLGLAYCPEDGINSDDLINIADQEMYKEKRKKEFRS